MPYTIEQLKARQAELESQREKSSEIESIELYLSLVERFEAEEIEQRCRIGR